MKYQLSRYDVTFSILRKFPTMGRNKDFGVEINPATARAELQSPDLKKMSEYNLKGKVAGSESSFENSEH